MSPADASGRARAGGRDVEMDGRRRAAGGVRGGQCGRGRGQAGAAAARPGAVRICRLLRGVVAGLLSRRRARRRDQAGRGSGRGRDRSGPRGDRGPRAIRHRHGRARHPRRARAAAIAAGAGLPAERRHGLLPRRRRFCFARRAGHREARPAAEQQYPRHRARYRLEGRGDRPRQDQIGPARSGPEPDALADRSVDAVPGSAWELPWLAREKGIALKSFDPADYRVEFYGDTLFTLAPPGHRRAGDGARFSDGIAEGLGLRAAAPGGDRRADALRAAAPGGRCRRGRLGPLSGGSGTPPGALSRTSRSVTRTPTGGTASRPA